MKKLYTFRVFLPAVLLATSACTPQLAYQVLETRAPAAATTNTDLALEYNFWNEGGAVACTVRNLTDAPLYIDLNRSHLIVNGMAQDYYQDQETMTSDAVAQTHVARSFSGISTSTQKTSSQRYHPKPVVQVPPHAAIVVGGLTALTTRVFHCDLEKWRSNKPATTTFTEADSPVKFRQFLTYSRRPDGTEPRTLDHAFWVERVSNMSTASFQGAIVKDERCGKKLLTTHPTLPYAKRGNLYVAFRPVSQF